MLKIRNKNIYMNRGDSANIQLYCNNAEFESSNNVRFHIIKVGNYENVLLTKEGEVPIGDSGINNLVNIEISSEETKALTEPFSSGTKTFWYEVELQDSETGRVITLLGHDEDGPRLFTLYPEAITVGEEA